MSASSSQSAPLLEVEHLSVEFRSTERVVAAVRNVSFSVGRGETVAIVGESGSGKSVTALSLMRLVEHGGGTITAGRMDFARDDGARTAHRSPSGKGTPWADRRARRFRPSIRRWTL